MSKERTPSPVQEGPAAGDAPDRTQLAALYEESRAMLGIGAKNCCEVGSNLWKRLLIYGSAALIGILLRQRGRETVNKEGRSQMVTKERREELLGLWISEQKDSWRDDWKESTSWRQKLTEEEKRLVDEWDKETPEAFGP